MVRAQKKRRILVITGSRGEYGYIRPVLKLIEHSGILEPEVLVTNMHLIPEFGNTIAEFEKDGIPVDYRIFMALSGYTNVTMLKSLGVFLLSLGDILENRPPDIILLAGDRGEQLIGAMAGAHMNIPVAHIQAGEVSGNIDGLSRHAIARFTHIHLAPNEDAAQRLIRSGEQEFRVFNVGAPQLDEFLAGHIAKPEEIAEAFSLDLTKGIILVVQHPVTEQADMAAFQMTETMMALAAFNDYQIVIIYPNNDAGSVAIQKCIQNNRHINIRVERSVSREVYGGLLNVASVLVGNSSSGIIEAPSFKLPVVNIGRRQEGRFRGDNVIDVEHHEAETIEKAIRHALSPDFVMSLEKSENPHGDGHSSERIVKILETIPIDEKLLYKKITF
ncbi:MAG: UDP-N-acetyl-D-glucosamine 2-epimerase, UDP-hydrolysing [Methanoculleus sp. SDB]|nr:MAG: UDP-N-acetyl-D-glucosamine 2-epimerase, UDP-hydrolysing [Methanoculleus sp. SDB]